MSNIYVIDDDAAAELLANNLTIRGHTATRIRSVEEALKNVDAISRSDLVVLDLIMPHELSVETQADGYRSSGMIVYKKLRETSQSLPIIVYTANQDGSIIDALSSDVASCYVPRWSGPSLAEFVEIMNKMLGVGSSASQPKVFIVHGQNEAAKLSLKNYLQNTLGLPEPIILHEQANQGRTLIEKIEDLAETADLVFVLLTPVDIAASFTDTDIVKRRARQNVVFEMGYFLGQLGRRSGRVLLLHQGQLELPSDISGLVYISIDSGIEAAGEQIRREVHALFN